MGNGQLRNRLRQTLCARLGREPELAVRSSATVEDLPEASFAGAAETFLNVRLLNPDAAIKTQFVIAATEKGATGKQPLESVLSLADAKLQTTTLPM